MNDSQKLLADYAHHGSEPAFTELVRRYLNFVYSTALRLTDGDSHLAEDVVQTVFADLARSSRSLSGNVMLGGWLHRHTCFVVSKIQRSERRRKTREREAVEMNAPDNSPNAAMAEIAPELDEAINQLSDEDRLAILLRFYEKRDFGGVGEGLGTSEEAARKRVSRAVEKLHASLTQRGVTLSAAGLGAVLGAGIVISAPAEMAAEVVALALAAGQGGVVTGGGLKILASGKIKLTLVAAALAIAAGTPLYMAHQTQVALREENQSLRTQVRQLTALHADASANVVKAQAAPVFTSPPSEAEEHRELLRLRGEVGVLRDKVAKETAATATNAAQTRSAQSEHADITYHFPGIPVDQLIQVYQDLLGKPVTVDPNILPGKSIWLETPAPLTRSQTLPWIESALKEQTQLAVVTNNDGSLSVVQALR